MSKKPKNCVSLKIYVLADSKATMFVFFLETLWNNAHWLLQIHGSDFGTPSAEVVRALDDLVQAGKIRYVGACNLLGWQLQKFIDLGKELNCSPWVTMQVPLTSVSYRNDRSIWHWQRRRTLKRVKICDRSILSGRGQPKCANHICSY